MPVLNGSIERFAEVKNARSLEGYIFGSKSSPTGCSDAYSVQSKVRSERLFGFLVAESDISPHAVQYAV